jgi:hypothetical protein
MSEDNTLIRTHDVMEFFSDYHEILKKIRSIENQLMNFLDILNGINDYRSASQERRYIDDIYVLLMMIRGLESRFLDRDNLHVYFEDLNSSGSNPDRIMVYLMDNLEDTLFLLSEIYRIQESVPFYSLFYTVFPLYKVVYRYFTLLDDTINIDNFDYIQEKRKVIDYSKIIIHVPNKNIEAFFEEQEVFFEDHEFPEY